MSCTCDTKCCCTDSVNGMRGSVHPDYIRSQSIDITTDGVTTAASRVVVDLSCHIISIDISLVCLATTVDGSGEISVAEPTSVDSVIRSATPVSISLFTVAKIEYDAALAAGRFLEQPTDDQNRVYISTCSLTPHAPNWQSHPDMFGYFADGGLFAEINAPSDYYGVRIVVRYVQRTEFPPAYYDPIQLLLNRWRCARGDEVEFLEGFYTGSNLFFEEIAGGSSGGTTTYISAPLAWTGDDPQGTNGGLPPPGGDDP